MPHSIPTTHSNEQKIIQDGRRNLPSILFAKGGPNIYIYPENLRAKAMLWLWPLRDVALTGYGVRTAEGELAFFLIKPDNLSVLSEEGVRGRVTALTHLLCAMPELRILALDSRESFQRNQEWYRQRLEQEELPALRELLRQDSAHLDEIQTTTASAREFGLVFRRDQQSGESDEVQLRQMEKRIRDQGFHVRLAEEQDVKRLLSVYYQQDVTTDRFEDCDGERGVMDRG